MLKKIFGPKGEELTADKRKFYIEEIRNLHFSPKVIRVTKSRGMRLAVHVARMGEKRGAYRVWWGNLKERGHLEGLDVDRRVILKCILKELAGIIWPELIWLRIGVSGGIL